MLTESLENEFLYNDVLKGQRYISPFLDIKDVLSHDNISVENIIDDYFLVNDDILLKGNSISSSFISSPILGFKHLNYSFNKTGRYSIYQDLKLPFIYRKKFTLKEKEEASVFFEKLSERGSVTISSNDFTDINANKNILGLSDFEKSWNKLSKISKTVTIENHQEGDVFNIFMHQGNIIRIYGIVPAFIIGDGESSISDLIFKLKDLRSKNILYKSIPLKNFNKDLDLTRIPIKGEIIRIKDSKKIQNGAVYINLTEAIKNKFEALTNEIVRLGINRSYLEIQCVSENISIGTEDQTFFISRVRQNTTDLRHLFAAVDDKNDFRHIVSSLFLSSSKKDSPITYVQPERYYNSHYEIPSSVDILKVAAYQLGYTFRQLDKNRLIITDGNKQVLFEYGMSEYTTTGARKLTSDKYLTKKLLNKANVNTPIGLDFPISEMEKAWNYMSEHCLKKGGRLVVKPLDSQGGTGVSTDITSKMEFEKAWNVCKQQKCKKVIIEQQLDGDDYRVVVIQNSVCAVSQRVSAFVIGDGEHSIQELISIKNKARMKNRFLKNSLIKISAQMLSYLSKRSISITDIPDKGERIRLSEVANASVGGEIIDRTEDMHPEWISVAVKARRAIANAYHVGLDIMMEDIAKSPTEQQWAIIEVNSRPDFGVQLFPTEGSPRNIGKVYLETIFGKRKLVKIGFKVSVLGDIQDAGYKEWFQSICHYRSVVGYITDGKDKEQIDAVIIGPRIVLNEVLKLSYIGPKQASVRNVIWEEIVVNDDEYEILEVI